MWPDSPESGAGLAESPAKPAARANEDRGEAADGETHANSCP